jgi:hypothetical protein
MGFFYTHEEDNIKEFERVKITYIFVNWENICRLCHQVINLFLVTVNKLIVSWYVTNSSRPQVTTIESNPS